MTFFNGNTDMDSLLNLWANELIATGQWVDNDVTWTGSRRSVRHVTDANFYLAFERQANNFGSMIFPLEIRIAVSSAWVANAPSGTIRYTGIPFMAGDGHAGGLPGGQSVPPNVSHTGQHWTWIDADGIVCLYRGTSSTYWDYSGVFILDRITSREYADGGSNFFVHCYVNNDAGGTNGSGTAARTYYADGGGVSHVATRHSYIRPFLTEVTASPGTAGIERYVSAFRSVGNSKAYFLFPFYSNSNVNPQRSPSAITDKWFPTTQGLGLADGDIIDYTAPGPILKRYLVKAVDSPDSVSPVDIAIRFA